MEFRLERVPSSRLLPPTAYTKLSITATPGREEERGREGGGEGGRRGREKRVRKREGGREGDERMMNLLYGCVHILLCIFSWYEFLLNGGGQLLK